MQRVGGHYSIKLQGQNTIVNVDIFREEVKHAAQATAKNISVHHLVNHSIQFLSRFLHPFS